MCKFDVLTEKLSLFVFSRLWTGSKLEHLQWKQWLQHWLNLRLVYYDPTPHIHNVEENHGPDWKLIEKIRDLI